MRDKSTIWDSPTSFGSVSRAFHWVMALMLFWQFASVILRAVAKDTAVYKLFWSAHFQLGFAILVLAILRSIWGFANLSRRPQLEGVTGMLATLVHLLIYGLMLAVLFVALLRNYANDRGFSFLGIQIFGQTGMKNSELALVGNWHGFMGWVLLVLVVGHVAMALIHHFVLRDNTLRYMAGPRQAV